MGFYLVTTVKKLTFSTGIALLFGFAASVMAQAGPSVTIFPASGQVRTGVPSDFGFTITAAGGLGNLNLDSFQLDITGSFSSAFSGSGCQRSAGSFFRLQEFLALMTQLGAQTSTAGDSVTVTFPRVVFPRNSIVTVSVSIKDSAGQPGAATASYADNVIHVDASAAPGGDGSSSRPYRSLTTALDSRPAPFSVVLVRPGVYSPATTGERFSINMLSNVAIVGSGPGQTIIDAGGTAASNLAGSPVVLVFGQAARNAVFSGFTVRNGGIAAIDIQESENVVVADNILENNGVSREAGGRGGSGVGLFNNSSGRIVGNISRNNGSDGVTAGRPNIRPIGPSKADIRANTGGPGNGEEGLGIVGEGSCGIIENNVAIGNARNGIGTFVLLNVGDDPSSVSSGSDADIIGNIAEGNGISGIVINDVSNSNVIGNIMRSNHDNGIGVTNRARAVVHDNIIEGNGIAGINVASGQSPFGPMEIQNNTVRNNSGDGILISRGSSANIIGNTSTDNGGVGIGIVDAGSFGNIVNNTALNNRGFTQNFIFRTSGANGTFSGNNEETRFF